MKYEQMCGELLELAHRHRFGIFLYQNYNHPIFEKRPDQPKRKLPQKQYDLVRLRNDIPGPGVLLTAGFHGNEKAGPLTILHHFKEIAEYATKKNIALTIYPCINPWGFNANRRYSCSKKIPNNDFLRYQLDNGTIVDDLKDSKEFTRYYWSSDPAMEKFLEKPLPFETQFLHDDLGRLALNNFQGAIDLHQDPMIENKGSYAYIFDKTESYAPIAEQVSKLVPLFRNQSIGSGQTSEMTTDEHGFIYRHDGTLTDLMHRQGCTYNVCVETTTKVSPKKAREVNMIWIKGIMDLVAESNK